MYVLQLLQYSIAGRFDVCSCVIRLSAGDVCWVVPGVDHVEQSSKLGFVGEELNLTQNSGSGCLMVVLPLMTVPKADAESRTIVGSRMCIPTQNLEAAKTPHSSEDCCLLSMGIFSM